MGRPYHDTGCGDGYILFSYWMKIGQCNNAESEARQATSNSEGSKVRKQIIHHYARTIPWNQVIACIFFCGDWLLRGLFVAETVINYIICVEI